MGKNNYFRGRNAVITGAASGIGRELALQLAKMGTNVVISDINMERLEQVKKEIEILGVKVLALKCDVTELLDARRLAEKSIAGMNDIHFLFSNAGIAIGGPFEHLDMSQWKQIVNINVFGMIHIVKAFINKLVNQEYGHIIVTASVAGIFGIGGLSPYNTTKFANIGFCESLLSEYRDKGINVSV